MDNKHRTEEEFKPVVIEPIEGQICYDELLTAQKEEEKQEEKPVTLEGQLGFWSMSSNPQSE